RTGAATCHLAASRLGYERVIRSVARVFLQSAPVLGGVSIIENQFHDTARIAVSLPEEMEAREEALFEEACRLMPQLPFQEVDLLIVDRLGKNVSGAGMDPNVIGRGVHGPRNEPAQEKQDGPLIRRIFVRDLTPETHGNAIGIGLADLTTARLVRAMDKQATFVNALTSLTPHSAKIPIHFETDREAVAEGLALLALPDTRLAKVVRIADTLSLASLAVSEPYLYQIKTRDDLAIVGPVEEMTFDSAGNLPPLQFH
ncbi:MAG: [Fe-S]-binding protein, partial [Chloroflexi bacterium]|nr:[Fe-S]-binding protein [Chloroflexota bacterium]